MIFYGDDRTVDTHVKTLRKNLGKYKDMIVTVRGLGYKILFMKTKKRKTSIQAKNFVLFI